MTPIKTTVSPARVVQKVALNKTSRIFHFFHPRIARRGQPGQFVQVLTSCGLEPFLPRPMSIFATDPRNSTFAILFAVVGPGTERLARLAIGDELPIFGPLGNTFSRPRGGRHVILVAGGVGLPPLDFWARRLRESRGKPPSDITMLAGARSDVERLRTPRIKGVRRLWSTDDGSCGFHGNVVELLDKKHREKKWSPDQATIYGCGPLPMLKALQQWMFDNDYSGQLSLEEMMPCGFGVCSGCVVPARPKREGYEKFKRVCYDGPVFDAREVVL